MFCTGILICCTGPFWSSSLCLFGFCLPVSSEPNFLPDTGRQRWSLIQVASSVVLRGGAGAAFPVYAAQAPGCSIRSVPCAARGSSPRGFHKSTEQKAAACILCLPQPSSSGSQELDGLTLPGCGAPSPLRGPSLSFCPCQSGVCAFSPPHSQPQSPPAPVGACALCLAATLPEDVLPSRISESLWLETGGLIAVW